MLKIKSPEVLFIIFAFFFGIIMLLKTLPGIVWDEVAHYNRAREVSTGKFYNKPNPEQITDYSSNSASGYSPVMYIGSSIGLKVFKNLWQGARFCNLIIWILLIATAIHITPVFKWIFFYTSLLPTSIYLGMSCSADSFNNAFAFLFIAYIFRLIYSNKDFSYKKDFPLLILFSIIGALCKGLIFPIFLVPLIPIKKHKYAIFITLLFISLGTAYLWSSNNQVSIRPDIYSEMNKYFIIHYPLIYLKLFINTVIVSLKSWIISSGAIITGIELGRQISYIILALFFGCLYYIPEKIQIPITHRILAMIIIIGQVFCTNLIMYNIFTEYGSNIIEGIQGRYFIPIIPLFFLIFSQHKTNKYTNSYTNILINATFIILCYTCYVI